MRYRELGKTGLRVSEIGLGGEWLERHNTEEVKEVIEVCEKQGINILDCWMSEPNVRSNIGLALKGKREKWIIQGHIGSIWEDGQYVRTRELAKVKPDFIKTSTGFGTSGADAEDVRLMKETVGDAVKVKAAGGIRDWETCRSMLMAGAERIGTSSSIKICDEFEKERGK